MPQHDIEHEVNATLIKEQTMNQQQQQIEACEACMQMVGLFQHHAVTSGEVPGDAVPSMGAAAGFLLAAWVWIKDEEREPQQELLIAEYLLLVHSSLSMVIKKGGDHELTRNARNGVHLLFQTLDMEAQQKSQDNRNAMLAQRKGQLN